MNLSGLIFTKYFSKTSELEITLEDKLFEINIPIKLYLFYTNQIRNTKNGNLLMQRLEADDRVRNLKGKLISKGYGQEAFEVEKLACWVAWCISEFGIDYAHTHLEKFLNTDDIPVQNTYWVNGISVKHVFDLGSNIKILPIQEMPESIEKKKYLKKSIYNIDSSLIQPVSAIVQECYVTKAWGNKARSPSTSEILNKSSEKIYYISLLINAITNVSCIPYLCTSETLNNIPYGLFSMPVGSPQFYDVFGYRLTELSVTDIEKLRQLMTLFFALNNNTQLRIARILSRFSQAKRRNQIEDKLIDLGITLEMALETNYGDGGYKEKVKQRGCFLIGDSFLEDLDTKFFLEKAYEERSIIVHHGTLDNIKDRKKDAIDRWINYEFITELIIAKLIEKGFPDWQSLTSGK